MAELIVINIGRRFTVSGIFHILEALILLKRQQGTVIPPFLPRRVKEMEVGWKVSVCRARGVANCSCSSASLPNPCSDPRSCPRDKPRSGDTTGASTQLKVCLPVFSCCTRARFARVTHIGNVISARSCMMHKYAPPATSLDKAGSLPVLSILHFVVLQVVF